MFVRVITSNLHVYLDGTNVVHAAFEKPLAIKLRPLSVQIVVSYEKFLTVIVAPCDDPLAMTVKLQMLCRAYMISISDWVKFVHIDASSSVKF